VLPSGSKAIIGSPGTVKANPADLPKPAPTTAQRIAALQQAYQAGTLSTAGQAELYGLQNGSDHSGDYYKKSSNQALAEMMANHLAGGHHSQAYYNKQDAAAAAAATPAARAAALASWQGNDPTYINEMSQLNNAQSNYDNDVATQKSGYDLNTYQPALQALGYTGALDSNGNAVASPGSWAYNDKNTAIGSSYQSQLGDYANRGMLQGTGYANALTNLQRSAQQSLDQATTARQTNQQALDAGQTAEDQQIQQQKNTAAANSAARFAATQNGLPNVKAS